MKKAEALGPHYPSLSSDMQYIPGSTIRDSLPDEKPRRQPGTSFLKLITSKRKLELTM